LNIKINPHFQSSLSYLIPETLSFRFPCFENQGFKEEGRAGKREKKFQEFEKI